MLETTQTRSEDCNCFAVGSAARPVTQLYDHMLASTGLRTTQHSILAKLSRIGSLSISALAERKMIDRTTLGRNIRPLERHGLIKAERTSSDRRATVLHLTAAGEKRLHAAHKKWSRAQERFEGTFGADRAGNLRALLRSVAASDFGRGSTGA
jgi:DNA-binding MarR family transcriptional regulator